MLTKISEAHWFNEEMAANLQKAAQLRKNVDKLYDKIDQLCKPFAEEVLRQISLSNIAEKADIEKMIRMLPDDFYRVELRTVLIRKFGR